MSWDNFHLYLDLICFLAAKLFTCLVEMSFTIIILFMSACLCKVFKNNFICLETCSHAQLFGSNVYVKEAINFLLHVGTLPTSIAQTRHFGRHKCGICVQFVGHGLLWMVRLTVVGESKKTEKTETL